MNIGTMLAGNCHVMDSNVAVIRHVRRAMIKKHRNDPSKRELRKQVYRDALAAHEANRKMFFEIARGDIGDGDLV